MHRAVPVLLAVLFAGCGAPDPAGTTDATDLVAEVDNGIGPSPVANATNATPPVLVAGDAAWSLALPAGAVGLVRVDAADTWTPRVDVVNGTAAGWIAWPEGQGPGGACAPLEAASWSRALDGAPPALEPGTYDLWLWHDAESAVLVTGGGQETPGAAAPLETGWRAAPLTVQYGPIGPRPMPDWSFQVEVPAGAIVIASLRHGTDVGPRSADVALSEGEACAQTSIVTGPTGAAWPRVQAVTSGPATWSGHYASAALLNGDVRASGVALFPARDAVPPTTGPPVA